MAFSSSVTGSIKNFAKQVADSIQPRPSSNLTGPQNLAGNFVRGALKGNIAPEGNNRYDQAAHAVGVGARRLAHDLKVGVGNVAQEISSAEGTSDIERAARQGNRSLLEGGLNRGGNIGHVNRFSGKNIAHTLAKYGGRDVEFLRSALFSADMHGNMVSLTQRDHKGRSPLMIAAARGNLILMSLAADRATAFRGTPNGVHLETREYRQLHDLAGNQQEMHAAIDRLRNANEGTDRATFREAPVAASLHNPYRSSAVAPEHTLPAPGVGRGVDASVQTNNADVPAAHFSSSPRSYSSTITWNHTPDNHLAGSQSPVKHTTGPFSPTTQIADATSRSGENVRKTQIFTTHTTVLLKPDRLPQNVHESRQTGIESAKSGAGAYGSGVRALTDFHERAIVTASSGRKVLDWLPPNP